MSSFRNPALEKFIAATGPEMVFGEVCLRATAEGHELCHVANRNDKPEKLRSLAIDELRALAQTTAEGQFRPLKSSPNLQSGWRVNTRNSAELERALNHLYPGAIADWYAAQGSSPPVTDYRDFTQRQTGMYRITTHLRDPQAADMIRACCHPSVCLKRRFWTVGGLPADAETDKSLIPCLEPCAILLEFARKAARLEQEEKVNTEFSTSELETLRQSLQRSSPSQGNRREADFNDAGNPRRRQLVLERIERMLAEAAAKRPPTGDAAD